MPRISAFSLRYECSRAQQASTAERAKNCQQYTRAILPRIPSPQLEFVCQPKVDSATISQHNIQGFASAFLSRARSPPFIFIALSMAIPTPAFLERTGPEIRTQKEIDSGCVEDAEPHLAGDVISYGRQR